jgi:hypothetical protein
VSVRADEHRRKERARRRFRLIIAPSLAVAGLLAFLPLQFADRDIADVGFAALAFIVILSLIAMAIYASSWAVLLMCVGYTFAAWILLTTYHNDVRESLRWFAFSGHYKSEVLASPPSRTPSLLRHAQWDIWGFAADDSIVYVVFDPGDSLLSASRLTSRPIRAAGVPCPVARVQRLEPRWYSVTFFTNTNWDDCSP